MAAIDAVVMGQMGGGRQMLCVEAFGIGSVWRLHVSSNTGQLVFGFRNRQNRAPQCRGRYSPHNEQVYCRLEGGVAWA